MSEPKGRLTQADIEQARGELVTVISRHVRLKQHGGEYRGLCPFHDDHDPSLQVIPRKGMYYCPSCQAHGDAIDFVRERTGATFREAVEQLLGRAPEIASDASPAGAAASPRAPVPDIYDDWQPVVPVPAHAPPLVAGQQTPPIANPKRWDDTKRRVKPWRPAMVHEYRAADGALTGYVLRINLQGAGKITPQVMWCRGPDGYEGWALRPFPTPRPLYGLDQLQARTDDLVVIVEGEKSADAARTLLPRPVVITWPGGTKGIKYADWSPLRGRRCVGWPDNDWQGIGAMVSVAKPDGTVTPGIAQLAPMAGFQVVDPSTCPDQDGVIGGAGADVADALKAGWTPEQTKAWVAANMRPVASWRPVAEPQRRPPGDDDPPQDDGPPPPDFMPEFQGAPGSLAPEDYMPSPNESSGQHFRFLGADHAKGAYFYLHRRGRVRTFPDTSLLDTSVHAVLAPIGWWEHNFPKKGGYDRVAAGNWLIRETERAGLHDPDTVRGRGAWWDEGRVMFHVGDRVFVDGHAVEPHQVPSKNLYQRAMPLGVEPTKPLSDEDAIAFEQICAELRWANALSGKLLAGWCIVAPLCGALAWRPNFWLSGPADSGKSWVINNIIRPALGRVHARFEGKSSEAGVRRKLASDALPVLFDEIEGETRAALLKIREVLDLARASSAADGASIVMASKDGGVDVYRITSCFLFASINVPITQEADATRWVVAELRKHDPKDQEASAAAQDHFAQLRKMVSQTITANFSTRLIARSLQLLPVILANIETFQEAARKVFGSARSGSLIGTLLAGWYSLRSHNKVTPEAAEKWLRGHAWGDTVAVGHESGGEVLLQELMAAKLRIQTGSSGIAYERSVGDLVAIVRHQFQDDLIPPSIATDALRGIGVKVERDGIWIANRHSALSRLLQDDAWKNGYAALLKHLPGAEASPGTINFGKLVKSRATKIPHEVFDGEENG